MRLGVEQSVAADDAGQNGASQLNAVLGGPLMRVWERDEDETHFMNVDVDVWSKSRLEPLVAALGRRIGIHYVGEEGKEFGAHFSLAYSFAKDADTLTRQLVPCNGQSGTVDPA